MSIDTTDTPDAPPVSPEEADAIRADLSAPQTGIFPGLSEEAYSEIPAVRSTWLKTLAAKTPAHLREQIQNPPRKKCFDLGNATHCAILQPERFDEGYVIAGQCCATVKSSGARCTNGGTMELNGEWFCGVRGHAPAITPALSRTVLSEEDYRRCIGMRDAAWAHKRVRKLLEAAGDREVSAVWRDEETGLYCKFRGDVFAAAGLIADIKSTDDASTEAFSKTIYNLGYHVSASFYGEGAAKVGRPVDGFYFIAVEKDRPHGVNLMRLDEEAIVIGHREARAALVEYAECVASGHWPCFGAEVHPVGLPAWVK